MMWLVSLIVGYWAGVGLEWSGKNSGREWWVSPLAAWAFIANGSYCLALLVVGVALGAFLVRVSEGST